LKTLEGTRYDPHTTQLGWPVLRGLRRRTLLRHGQRETCDPRDEDPPNAGVLQLDRYSWKKEGFAVTTERSLGTLFDRYSKTTAIPPEQASCHLRKDRRLYD